MTRDHEIIRIAENDWPVLRKVRLAALADAPGSFGTTLAEEQAYAEDHWRETARSGAVFVARADGSSIGIAAGIPRSRPAECGLGAMWVAPSWRGSGVADSLVAEVLGWARSQRRLHVGLWAPADNIRACRFYARHGFVATGVTRPFPSAPGRHISEMFLQLPPDAPARAAVLG